MGRLAAQNVLRPSPAGALGKKGSKWFMINAFALMAVFFACRVAWGTAMSAFFWWCTRQALLGRMDPGVPLWAVWPTRAANLIMMTLNYNWFSRMVMVAYKVSQGGTWVGCGGVAWRSG